MAKLERDLRSIEDRITRQIETQERERAELEKHLSARIGELEKLMNAVLDEQRRGMAVAEQEREKSAQALRDGLERAVKEGDDRLREHVGNQIQQVNSALDSAEKLELERVEAAETLAGAVRRELMLVQNSAKEAIDKADVATDKRFESVNELRAQMNDLILSHQTSLSTLTERLMLREVADAQFSEVRKKLDDAREDRDGKLPREVFDRTIAELTTWRSGVDKRLHVEAGRDRGTSERRTTSATDTQLLLARGGLVVAAIGLVITVVLAANGVF